MNKKHVHLGIACIFVIIGIILIVVFWPIIGTINNKELSDSFDDRKDEFDSGLREYKDGDIILILDIIERMEYNETGDYTEIAFQSGGDKRKIEGDLNNDFNIGDNILMRFYVVEGQSYDLAYPNGIHYKTVSHEKDFWTVHDSTNASWTDENHIYGVIPQNQVSAPPQILGIVGLLLVFIGIGYFMVYYLRTFFVNKKNE